MSDSLNRKRQIQKLEEYMTPNTIEFRSTSDNTWVMRITADRKIEVNEDVEVTEAAQKVLDAMQPLLKAQRTEQEPVAWITPDGEGFRIRFSPPTNDVPLGWDALYKDPKPCPTCEALARTVMLDQASHDTHSPQRTWVGLDDSERFRLWLKTKSEDVDRYAFAQAIEAKLKELNI